MFTYQNWNYFCSEIEKRNIKTYTAKDLIKQKKQNFVIIKHDVETNVEKALKLAQIENEFNIKATYYVQSYLLNDENINYLKEIFKLGHEVTYHYDVLDSNQGDWDKADNEFHDTISLFDKFGFKVRTVCPHGNPIMERKGWDSNKDFFRNKVIHTKYSEIVDIVIDVKKFGENINYVSDAGYGYKLIGDISNNDRDKTKKDIPLHDINAILNLLEKNKNVIVSTHPHRWGNSEINAKLKKGVFLFLRAGVRFLTKYKFFNKIIGKFYYLAKKI